MSVVMSPSGLSTYRQCPLRFYGQSISREIPWQDSPAKARGTALHSALEKALHGDDAALGQTLDDTIDAAYVRACVHMLRSRVSEGYALATEHMLVMNRKGEAKDWWSIDAFLRAKADVFLHNAGAEWPVLIGDWKTGRIWDKDAFQLRVEALLAHVLYDAPRVQYAYWYIDQGETVEGEIDFTKGLADVADIYELMTEFRESVKNNYWPPTKNRFCKWCPWHKTESCDL